MFYLLCQEAYYWGCFCICFRLWWCYLWECISQYTDTPGWCVVLDSALCFITGDNNGTHQQQQLYNKVGRPAISVKRDGHWKIFIYKSIISLLPPYLSSLISWNCNTLSTRSQSYLSLYQPHDRIREDSLLLENTFHLEQARKLLEIVCFWENVLTLSPFQDNSPVVTVIANCFYIQHWCCSIVFYLIVLYFILLFYQMY